MFSTFEERYDGWNFLFTSVKGNSEEENTVRLLQHIAQEAGYNTEFAYIDDIEFSCRRRYILQQQTMNSGSNSSHGKTLPLKSLTWLCFLTISSKTRKPSFLTRLMPCSFKVKALLKILWDLYPNHPLLLETSFEPLEAQKQVEKPIFGREGGICHYHR